MKVLPIVVLLSTRFAWADAIDPTAIQARLGVSPVIAQVTETHNLAPQAKPDFILIQDVHRNPLVQARIAALIVFAYDHWGAKKVFLEGAFSALDLSVFHRIPNQTRLLLMERLVKDGDLSGPELAGVQIMEREWRNPPTSPFQIFGMEDPKLYRKNVLAYQSVLSNRHRALSDISDIRRLHHSIRLSGPNPLLRQLDRVELLVHLKLTPTEYGAYLREKKSVPSTPALNPVVRSAEEFYRLANLRSKVFVKKAIRRAPAAGGPRVVVVGGFHTEAMAKILRDGGYSYVVLSPTVGSHANSLIYEKRLRDTASFYTEALASPAR